MLEGLDQIDWSKLYHAYGTAENTPTYLRLLLSPNEEDRDKAHAHLMHSVHHQGAVESVTSAVVPFLIELVGDEETPDRAWILSYLNSLLESCNYIPSVHSDWETPIMMGVLRHEMDTYSNIIAGLDLYISLLTHPDDTIRGWAAWIVWHMPDCRYQSLAPLWQALQKESSPNVLLAQMESIDQLFAYVNRFDVVSDDIPDRKTVMQVVDKLAVSHSEFDVRVKAAITLTNMTERVWINKTIPPYIGTILVETLTDQAGNARGSDWAVIKCIRTTGVRGMAGLLTLENLNDRAAHLIGREMLDQAFQRKGHRSYEPWSAYADQILEPSKTKYRPPENHSQYTGGKLRNLVHREAVKAIVACDPFWEYPTNLLSFFYGLPDEREQLRALLAED